MGLETVTYLPELIQTNPIGASDPKSEGDDHLKIIKKALLNTFGSFVGTAGSPKSVTLTEDQINDCLQKAVNNTLVGRLVTDDSTTSRAGFNIPNGVAPSSPVQGDIWATATDVLVRNNGVTSSMIAAEGDLKLKTSSVTINSDASLNDDAAITGITIGTGSAHYEVTGVLFVTSSVSADFRAKFDWSELPTDIGIHLINVSSSGGVNVDAQTSSGSVMTLNHGGITKQIYQIRGVFKANATPGTLKLQWAQGTSHVDDTTLHAGSFVRIIKIS